MASTITINQTLSWVAPFILGRPTKGVLGATNEPALTSANKILQMMLAPPFRWSWNRIQTTFYTIVNQSDYVINVSNWGYLEKATSYNASDTTPTREVEVYQTLAADTVAGPPQRIVPMFDDGNGNITFRVFPSPDNIYLMTITMQKAAPLLTDLSGSWSPVPDKYAYLYEQGLLATLQGMYSERMYALNMQLFLRQLVAASEGLSETERAIFLEDRLRDPRMQAMELTGVQQGKQSRVL